MKTILPISIVATVVALLLPMSASADLLHWSYRAKVPLAKRRIYDLNEHGEPLSGKNQGSARASDKMFGLFDVRGVDVCLESGQQSRRIVFATNAKEQRLTFYVYECMRTEIRIHFNRPITRADYAPAKLVQYLSGIFDIEGFGAEPLGAALEAQIGKAELNGRHVSFSGMEFEAPAEYQAPAGYAGGAFMRSTATKDNRYYFSSLVLSRPMTPDELAVGAAGTLEHLRKIEARMLPVKVGGFKNMKKVQFETGSLATAPRLMVKYQASIDFLRRDYIVDENSRRIYYVETSCAKKFEKLADPAVDKLLQAMRLRELPAESALSKLVAPAQETLSSPGAGSASSAVPETPESRTGPSYSPAVEIVSASVQPAETSPGEEISLLMQYRVTGVPDGFAFEILERRELLANGKVIAAIEESFSRGAGETTSAKKVKVPASTAPGFYSFRAQVTFAGIRTEASSFFKVK